MQLVKNCYGKGGVRVMRVDRSGPQHVVRELNVKAIVEGDFARAYTDKDNSTSLCTDTVKNLVNIVAYENIALDTEKFCQTVAARFLKEYPQVESVSVHADETKWVRMTDAGAELPYGFIHDANGKPFADVAATRNGMTTKSGINGFTFLKTTESGWDNFYKDAYTTLAETRDRIAATAMEASWTWAQAPADFATANALILKTMLKVFATTYSESVQDSLFRMASAALEAVPEIADVSLACPNKHYIPMNLSAFGIDNHLAVFLPTDEPHGQIECTVAR